MRWLCGQYVHAPSCEQRPGGRNQSQRCMMCTLPSESVSFCLSAAAKSLLNKKADVKVRQPISLSLFCVSFLPLSASVLGCMSTKSLSLCPAPLPKTHWRKGLTRLFVSQSTAWVFCFIYWALGGQCSAPRHPFQFGTFHLCFVCHWSFTYLFLTFCST